MQKFDAIRPFYDHEINEAILSSVNHPMLKALMQFTFPDLADDVWKTNLKQTHSIKDFQSKFIYKTLLKILEKSSDGLTTTGFEKLEKNTAYLFISNHRDIILDTSLLNACLFENDLIMTASAIGDNLVKKAFMHALAKMNRNFLVQRGLTPREMLQSSKTMSEYISETLLKDNRSVWIAQREGRTKDGNDATNSGVLKMLSMGASELDLIDYFKKIKIVPISISYEYDPTDALKMPQILAESKNEIYIKDKNEDFLNLMSGVMGQKKHIHIHVCDVLNTELDEIAANFDTVNKQVQALATSIDKAIISHYKLHATNYIAHDILYKTDKYASFYTENEKSLFKRRLELRIDNNNPILYEGFLNMYANPVLNKLKFQ